MKKNFSHPEVIILGIDGLEYNLVKEWKLTNIMQKTYCELDLSEYDVIITPPIWGSMLTGKIDKEIMNIWVKQAELVGGGFNTKQKWWTKIGEIMPPKVDIWVWENIFCPIIGGNPFEKTANYILEKNQKNIFHFFKKTWTNGIPSYGKNVSSPIDRRLIQNAIIFKNDDAFKENVIKNYKRDKEYLLTTLDKYEHDLIFWYTTILDKCGHVYMRKPLTLMNYYLEINNLIGKVVNRFQDSCIFIISDHGMQLFKGRWGLHSDHGFFSSNTGEIINKPYDLYNLVLKHKTI
jgi:hypothetical protein